MNWQLLILIYWLNKLKMCITDELSGEMLKEINSLASSIMKNFQLYLDNLNDNTYLSQYVGTKEEI